MVGLILSWTQSSSWHPAPPGHQLVADMLFMHYAEVFLGAMKRLDGAAPGVTASQLRGLEDFAPDNAAAAVAGNRKIPEVEMRWRSTKPSLRDDLNLGVGAVYDADEHGENNNDRDSVFMGGGRGDILPPPAWCSEEMLCTGAGNYRCSSTYLPLAGGETASRLVNMVVASEEEEGTATPPVLNHDHSSYFVEPSVGRWAVTLNEVAPNLKAYLDIVPPAGFHHPIDMKWCLVGDQASGPIEFEFETVGIPPGKQKEKKGEIGKEDGDQSRRAMTEQQQQQQVNWVPQNERVVVCMPDFIEHADLTNQTQVVFRVDGVEAHAEELVQGHMVEGACVVLAAHVVGVGQHRLIVEPRQSGEPYVAISHVVYPA